MPEMNTIFDASDQIVGIFRFGVAWKKDPRFRLGTYCDNHIYDNTGQLLATYDGSNVISTTGESLGTAAKGTLSVNGSLVGKYIGYDITGAAAIVFLFSDFDLPAYNNSKNE